jgi:hypothetical protein
LRGRLFYTGPRAAARDPGPGARPGGCELFESGSPFGGRGPAAVLEEHLRRMAGRSVNRAVRARRGIRRLLRCVRALFVLRRWRALRRPVRTRVHQGVRCPGSAAAATRLAAHSALQGAASGHVRAGCLSGTLKDIGTGTCAARQKAAQVTGASPGLSTNLGSLSGDHSPHLPHPGLFFL